jgi:dimethylaniline monooxygenase (N-oxide forming)
LVSEEKASSHKPNRQRVAVIGAGVSGLATAKCLLDEGLEPVVFEQKSEIGGLWSYHEELPDGGSVVYRSLRTNTSKQTLAFSDFPLPENLPDFPHHTAVLQYLQNYASHFGLQQYILLNTIVESVEPTEQWKWTVCTRTGETTTTETFDAVIVCTGRDRYPALPDIPGSKTFSGEILHSSRYKGPEDFAGKDVVVAGVGSSGVDIVVEVSEVGRQTYLSTTNGAWFIPRYVLKQPYDHQLTRLASRLPYKVRMFIFRQLLLREYRHAGVNIHQLHSTGLPLPEFDLWCARLTPCNDLLPRMQRGAILVKPQIARFEGKQVIFADGSQVGADIIICCTGYTLRFPFFPEKLITIKRNGVELYKHVFHPELPNLAFVGLCTVAGAHIPVAEIQGRWAASVLASKMQLPTWKEMSLAIEQYRSHPSNQSPIPMEVQLLEYVDEIAAILGVRPRLWRHLRLLPDLLLGPFSAKHYRLDGPGKDV